MGEMQCESMEKKSALIIARNLDERGGYLCW